MIRITTKVGDLFMEAENEREESDRIKLYDSQSRYALESGKLTLGNNNWIEYDGVIKNVDTDSTGVFVDLGMICDNILDDDILSAIEQVLDSIEEIKNEIIDAAENHYDIKVGDV